MPSFRNKSVTLIELIIAISLVAVIILGINSVSIFSHYQIISSDRRAKLQNDISYCLDHITKQGMKTIGNEMVFGSNSAVSIGASPISLAFFIDADNDGQKDASDYWIGYVYDGSELSYYDNCGSGAAPACSVSTEVLSNKIKDFTPNRPPNFADGNNHIEVSISGCWNPDPAAVPACNTPDNPEVTMQATVNLPSVSTN